MNAEQSDSFDRDGYIIVRNFLKTSAVDDLAQQIDRIYAQWLAQNRADYAGEGLVNMHSLTSPHYFSDRAARTRFFDSIAPEQLTALVARLFGDGIYFHNTQLFFNPLEKPRHPYWHRDLQYSPVDDAAQAREQRNLLSLHIRIPLIAEKGIELIPGTHRRWDTGLESDVRFERNGHSNSDDLPCAILLELQPGDILIFDAQMIHRGNYALNKERKALDLCVGKAHPFTLPYLDRSVLPEEEELDHIRSNSWYRLARELATTKP